MHSREAKNCFGVDSFGGADTQMLLNRPKLQPGPNAEIVFFIALPMKLSQQQPPDLIQHAHQT